MRNIFEQFNEKPRSTEGMRFFLCELMAYGPEKVKEFYSKEIAVDPELFDDLFKIPLGMSIYTESGIGALASKLGIT